MSTQDGTNGTTQYNFLSLLARGCPKGLHFLVTLKQDKRFTTWAWDGKQLPPGAWYFYTGASDHKKLRRDENTHAVRAIVIDDVGTKVQAERILAAPTWILETSPGNYQWGFLLEEWTEDIQGADALFAGLVAAGLQDKGVSKACRLFRIPGSINDKPGRDSFEAVLHGFDASCVYTLESLETALKILPGKRQPKRERPEAPPAAGQDDPVFDWLHKNGHILERKNAAGWWLITCPFAEEHTDKELVDAKYMHRADSDNGRGNVCCHHGHGENKAHYSQRFFDWVQASGGPANQTFNSAISESTRAALAAIVKGAEGFKEGPDPVAPADLYNFGTLRIALGSIDILKLPQVERTKEQEPKSIQPTSYSNVEAGLEQLGVKPRLNLMTAETSYILPEHIDMARFGNMEEHEIATLVEGALTDIFGWARMKNEAKLKVCLDRIANSNFWHPMRDWILSKEWDGKDRLELLAKSVTTPTPGPWRLYLRRWALQTIEASCGWTIRRKSQKGMVLVLTGKQRIGKTRWFTSLAPDFSKVGKNLNLNGHGARDSKHEALQGVIVELGELDATFKKTDIAALKAFITEITDEYRLPYAAGWLKRPRCASFCGSVNDRRFLSDYTGSGRFLVIEAEGKLDVDHGVDMQQFWAQMYAAWEGGEQHWLTDAEEEMRDELSSNFQTVDVVAEKIEESLDRRKDADKYPIQVVVGPVHMLELCGLDGTSTKNHAAAGIAMEQILGRPRNLSRRGATTKSCTRWIIQATEREVHDNKLIIAKPEVASE
jgi:putative DNA primase/helicase